MQKKPPEPNNPAPRLCGTLLVTHIGENRFELLIGQGNETPRTFVLATGDLNQLQQEFRAIIDARD